MTSTISLANTPTSLQNLDLVTLYCILDDYLALFSPKRVGRKPSLSLSEIGTIVVLQCKYEIKTLKALHLLLKEKYGSDFTLPEYANFVNLMNKYAPYLLQSIHTLLQLVSKEDVVCFVDSTSLPVCKIYRWTKHRTAKSISSRGVSSLGWFYGMKLHIICNKQGELLSFRFTTGSVNDRTPLKEFLKEMKKCLVVGDAGYLGQELIQAAWINQNHILTTVRKNMKTLATHWQQKMMNKRSRVETVFGELKERYGLVTSLPRSINGYLAHYIRKIFAYVVS